MINKSFILILCTILLSSCAVSKQRAEISAPELHCDADITIEQNEELDIGDYCTVIPEDSVISVQGEADTSFTGKHTLSVIVTDCKHNNFTLEEIAYIVVKPVPVCPENASYDEESESCICKEGYVDIGDGELICEPKAVCDAGYWYRESDNTCVKSNPSSTPAPSKPSQATFPNNEQSQPSPQEKSTPEPVSEPPSQPIEPEPTPAPQPTAEIQPTPSPSTSGSRTCVPAGNSQQALDDAYNACALECSGHGNCEVYWDGSAYVANWH